jgi:hypothetical protein
MNTEQEFERVFRQEFRGLVDKTIYQDADGEYHVFGRYIIRPELDGYRVFCSATDVGVFTSTRTALSWCVADKHKSYALARDLQTLDQKLGHITNDIAVRAAVGDRSLKPQFREDIEIKLEGKIILKKQLELQLAKCVNQAKYYQQRGLDNETARTGRKPNKTSR